MRQLAMVALAAALFCISASAQLATLRYKLSPGDHLTYRETFERAITGDTRARTRVTFTNHVAVIADANGDALTATQRNRESAEILEYRENGADRLARARADFQTQLAKRDPHFVDTNVYTTTGTPRLPLQAVREVTSSVLFLVPEIEPLPLRVKDDQATWTHATLGIPMRFARMEDLAGESCALLEAAQDSGRASIRYWFCPQTGVVRKLHFEARYPGHGNLQIHESLTYELSGVAHGESASQWLADPSVQQAVLQAYLTAAPSLPINRADILASLAASDPHVQALALAVLYRKRLAPPEPAQLQQLANSSDSEVRRLALRFLKSPASAQSTGCLPPRPPARVQKVGATLFHMSAAAYAGVPYIMHVPIDYDGTQPFPLLIDLSGGAGYAIDGANTSETAVAHSGYLVLYPQANGGLWWSDSARDTFPVLLDEVLRTFNVDTNRVYLTGFSNGASGAIYYATLWPQRFAALSLLMGGGVDTPEVSPLPLQNLTNIPTLLIHGSDDPIIPATVTQRTYDELRRLSPRVPPEIHILKGREHDVTLNTDDGLTLPFLARFQRDPFPRRISARIKDLRFARHYWIQVLENSGSVAEIDGQITDDNTIELKTKHVSRLRLLLRPELLHGGESFRVVINGKQVASSQMHNDCALLTGTAAQLLDPALAYSDQIDFDVRK